MASKGSAEAQGPKKVFGGFSNVVLKLESSEDVNHNVKKLRFALPEPDAVSGLPLTSTLLTVSWPKGSWVPVPRPYTPVSSSDTPGYVDLLIKKYPGGKGSGHLHSLSPGDTLRFLLTIPGFKWARNMFPHITLVAGGQGITPIYQLIQGILADPEDTTRITLVYGANSDADVLLKQEFDAFSGAHPDRFRAVYTVSKPAEDSPYRQGHVTKELLKETMPEETNTKVFVCGPPPMEQALCGKTGILADLGYGKDKVHKF